MSDTKKVSGFDMTDTLLWYWVNLALVVRNLPVSAPAIRGVKIPTPGFKETANGDGTPADEIDASSFVGLAGLMPPQALARSYLRDVVIKPPRWFHHGSTGEKPIPTYNIDDALSPGAIIPSFIDYAKWNEGECPGERFPYATYIEMYEIPGIGLPHKLLDHPTHKLRSALRRVVWSQAFLHELGHSILTPVLFGGVGQNKLCLPDGRIVDQYEFAMEALPIVRGLPPISHYASAYSNPDGSLKLDKLDTVHTALGEHLVEAMAAHLLGFAYQPDGNGLEPFARSAPLRDFVDAFLHAEWVD